MTWCEGEQVQKDFIDTNSVNFEKSHNGDVELECSYTYSSDKDTETGCIICLKIFRFLSRYL